MRYIIFTLLLIVVFFIVGYNFTVNRFKSEISGKGNSIVYYDVNRRPFYISNTEMTLNFVTIENIDNSLLKAVIALEDSRFFQHFGFDVPRIILASISWISSGQPTFGASTITQQLCKITLFNPERTIKRKLLELFCSISLEIKYTKKQILEYYLNSIYYGSGNVGILSAASNFFNKQPNQLTMAESALIAGLIKRPEVYSPLNDIHLTRSRQIIVLKRMLKLGWITIDEYKQSIEESVVFHQSKKRSLIAPYFTAAVTNQLKAKFGTEIFAKNGINIYTTLDTKKQRILEEVINNQSFEYNPSAEVAAVVISKEGYVQSIVGGRSFVNSQFNRAIQAKRQPGSAIKPLVYSLAFKYGWMPNDTLIDEYTSFPNYELIDTTLVEENNYYEPGNFDGQHRGELTLAYALQISNNVIAVKLLEQLGTSEFIEFSDDLGLNFTAQQGLCLALGCGETNLLSLTNAFTIFTNQGEYCAPQLIMSVTDSNGRIIYSNNDLDCLPIISEGDAFIMQQLLHNVVEKGTATNARINNYAGGKTGTTSNNRDAWFIGFSGGLTVGFWLGNDDNQPLIYESGGNTPAKLWKNYMDALNLEDIQPKLPSEIWEILIFNKYFGCLSDENDIDMYKLNLISDSILEVCN